VKTEEIRTYLKKLGFPRCWVRTNEAIALLKEYRMPVSPAAQEIVRLYGGLVTHLDEAPEGSLTFYIDPVRLVATGGASVAEETAYTEHVNGVADLCPIGFHCWELGIICIAPDNTIYLSSGDYFKGETVDEAVEHLISGRADGLNVDPDAENDPPQYRW